MLDDFKNNLKKIFESKSLFNEEETAKKEFIYTTPEGVVYKVEAEPSEGEFYVYDKNGKQIDLFNMELANSDGALLKNIRQGIVDQFKSLNTSGTDSQELGDDVKVAEGVVNPGQDKKTAVTQKLPVVKPTPPEDKRTAVTQKLTAVKEEAPVDKKNAETVRMEKPKNPNEVETVKITKPNGAPKE